MNDKEYTVLVKISAELRDAAKAQSRVLGIRLSELYRQALTSGLNERADALDRIIKQNIPA